MSATSLTRLSETSTVESSANDEGRVAKVGALAAAGIVLLGFVARVNGLGDRPLWFDEGYTAYLQAQGPAYIWSEIVPDHVPLHYLLLHFWTQVAGNGEFALRFISVFFGTLSLPLAFVIARHLLGPAVGLASLLLASLAPYLVYWTQQARPSNAALFLSLAILWFSLKVLAPAEDVAAQKGPKGKTILAWIGWGTSSVLGLFTFYYVGIFMLVASTYFLFRARSLRANKLLHQWIVCHGIVIAVFLPWVISRWQSLVSYVSAGRGNGATRLGQTICTEDGR